MEIKRDVYLNRLIVREGNGFIKVITGIRRCGKSYLMNNIFYNYLLSKGINESNIIKFAFDSAEDLMQIDEDIIEISEQNRKVDPKKFMKYIASKIDNGQKYYLLLDEVQLLGSFEAVLNGYLRKENLDIYVTGSNSKFLSSDILTEFEGRGDEIHVLPLSFSEFYSAYDGSKDEAFDDYMVYGGLPAVALMKTDEQKSNYLITQMKNVYIKDIVARNSLNSDQEISELVDILASGISSLTNPRKLENTFKSVKNSTLCASTIDKYIGYLKDSFLLSKAERYDVKGIPLINAYSPNKSRKKDNIFTHVLLNDKYRISHAPKKILPNNKSSVPWIPFFFNNFGISVANPSDPIIIKHHCTIVFATLFPK